MTALIAYPFRVTPTGDVATNEQDSETQLAGELAVGILTRPEEREFLDGFGVADPVFRGFDLEALRLHVSLFGPPVDVDAVDVEFPDDTTQRVVVTFTSE